ncbi:hypothetical protein [Paenibacillus amylolyticus]|uniref:hypothetical protein n=1 Tax=Paenibacillus amylolyticus TaxID=1451 RepID=UPI003396E417
MEQRKDAWDADADLYLAQTVLKHIESGSTQLKAFEEAGEKLSRTSGACGFRWNGALRKRYETAIEKARLVRIQNKDQQKIIMIKESKPSMVQETQQINSKKDVVLSYPSDQNILSAVNEAMDQVSNSMNILRQIIDTLEGRLKTATDRNTQLQSEYANLQNEIINAVDMKVFLRIANTLDSKQFIG